MQLPSHFFLSPISLLNCQVYSLAQSTTGPVLRHTSGCCDLVGATSNNSQGLASNSTFCVYRYVLQPSLGQPVSHLALEHPDGCCSLAQLDTTLTQRTCMLTGVTTLPSPEPALVLPMGPAASVGCPQVPYQTYSQPRILYLSEHAAVQPDLTSTLSRHLLECAAA